MMFSRTFAALAVAFLFALSCPAATAAKPGAGKSRAGAAQSDAVIEKAIQTRLARSAKISADHFTVHVQGGVATLSGKTDVIQHKGAATRMAKAAGARQVVNRIEISEAAREKAANNLAKGRRRAQLKRGDERSQAR